MWRLLSSQEHIIDAWLQFRSNAGTMKLYSFPDSLCPVYARISLLLRAACRQGALGTCQAPTRPIKSGSALQQAPRGFMGHLMVWEALAYRVSGNQEWREGEGLPSPEAGSQWEGTWHFEPVKGDQYTGTKARHVHSWETLSLLLLWRETEKRCGSWELTDYLIVSSTTPGRTHKPIMLLLWIVYQTHSSTVSDEKILFSSNFAHWGRWR